MAKQRPFLAYSNLANAKLYDEEVSSIKITCVDKFGKPTTVLVPTQSSVEEFKSIYQQVIGPLLTEINRPSIPLLQAIFYGSSSHGE